LQEIFVTEIPPTTAAVKGRRKKTTVPEPAPSPTAPDPRQDSAALARLCVQAGEDAKALDCCILDLRGLVWYADYFVLMSGGSTRHVQGLTEAVEKALRAHGMKPRHREGQGDGHWVLLDCEDVVVHIFYRETREFYNLDGLWHDAPRLPLTAEDTGSAGPGA
jgi:ribosome-associated protein